MNSMLISSGTKGKNRIAYISLADSLTVALQKVKGQVRFHGLLLDGKYVIRCEFQLLAFSSILQGYLSDFLKQGKSYYIGSSRIELDSNKLRIMYSGASNGDALRPEDCLIDKDKCIFVKSVCDQFASTNYSEKSTYSSRVLLDIYPRSQGK